MKIKCITINACVKLEKFCKEAGIKFSTDPVEEAFSSEEHLYDMWLDDKEFNFIKNKPIEGREATVKFYTHEYMHEMSITDFAVIEIL